MTDNIIVDNNLIRHKRKNKNKKTLAKGECNMILHINDKPTVNTDKPTVNTDKPSVNTDKPTVNTDKPTVNTDKPTVNTDKPTVNTDKPSVDNYDYICNIKKLLAIVERTYKSIKLYKLLYIIDSREIYNCTLALQNISINLNNVLALLKHNKNIDEISFTNALKEITSDLQLNIKSYGTADIEDVLYLCFADIPIFDSKTCDKYKLLLKYAHPINYTIVDVCDEPSAILECIDVFTGNDILPDNVYKSFNNNVYCIQVLIHYKTQLLTMICLVDDIYLDILNDHYIKTKIETISYNDAIIDNKTKQWYDYLHTHMFDIYKKCLTLKDLLIYNETELHDKYIEYMDVIGKIHNTSLEKVISEFIKLNLYKKRSQLMCLLINSENQEFQFISYLLYDLLSNDTSGNIDTTEQILLFDSLPFKMKQLFHAAMKETINYTKKISNTDINNIPLEQRICLLKAPDKVKEKAMLKLKEIKAKNEDSGSKARHYLDGLLKIPFTIQKEEPILSINKECIKLFNTLITQVGCSEHSIPIKDNYNALEIQHYSHLLKTDVMNNLYKELTTIIYTIINSANRKTLVDIIININKLIKDKDIAYNKIKYVNIKLNDLRTELIKIYNKLVALCLSTYMHKLINNLTIFTNITSDNSIILSKLKSKLHTIDLITNTTEIIDKKYLQRSTYLNSIKETLDKSVYGHISAKRQLERIIGQWVNGENKGYCFGFEGPPGVGKTSLAKKGIADCLKDENGVSRPFAFIAIGGSANGSTLEGHNYTYVGSTWGKIVDILMETKCMNPIIFIDELDKVSKTEHGKEIISILTHLVDPTQNDVFQDKYFNGVDIDVSNILFVFSYNDANLIDKILLDRIHRIKFDNLSLDDKLIIAKEFILPDIYVKMGLVDIITIDDEDIEYIIEEYTAESGVRKLKELLFDIVGEINLELLRNNSLDNKFPRHITKKDIQDKYLKDHDEVKLAKIHNSNTIGIINGLWANSVGKGGVLPIEARFFPASTFLDLKLTGMQGDVMKESMNVAKTLAWSLLDTDTKRAYEDANSIKQGIHIHVPEGSTPKDGPSAGTAITVVMYSLLTQRKIKHDLAITGEICLSGKVTAIGGLELKILGGIKAGVKTFIFPQDNCKDFIKINKKYGEKPMFKEVKFIPVEHIDAVLLEVFV